MAGQENPGIQRLLWRPAARRAAPAPVRCFAERV